MSQLYVPEGTWVLCSEGKKIPRIQVASQSTTRIAGGKLSATEDDRFDGNFVCLKMAAAGVVLGAVAGLTIAATGGAALGVIAAATVAGAGTGALAGALAGKIPSICSLLCKPSDWTITHPRVKIEGKKALLQKATLSCLLGGTITLKMPDLQESIDMGLLAGNDVYNDSSADTLKDPALTDAERDRISQYERVSDRDLKRLKLDPRMFHPPNDKGFYAQLYKKGDTYILAYRGTKEMPNDAIEDGLQGVGISIDQYNKSVDLANAVKTALPPDQKVIITGHSLGGGLAAIASGATSYPTYTYNAAGVHDYTLAKNAVKRESMSHVQAYNASSDPLNMAQDNREVLLSHMGWLGAAVYLTHGLPRAAGQRMQIPTDVSILKGHTAIYIVNQLEKELAAKEGNSSVIAKEL